MESGERQGKGSKGKESERRRLVGQESVNDMETDGIIPNLTIGVRMFVYSNATFIDYEHIALFRPR